MNLLVVLFTFIFVASLLLRKGKPRKQPDPLEAAVLDFGRDSLTMRDMLRSIICVGAPGSGKSSGTLENVERGLLHNNTGLLILESKPEEAEVHDRLIRQAGRQSDHVIFGPGFSARMNVFDALHELGADAKMYTRYLLNMGEVIDHKAGGGDEAPVWAAMRESHFECALEMLIQAYGTFTIGDLQEFLSSAPLSGEDMKSDRFRGGYCNTTFLIVAWNVKSVIEARNFRHCFNTWIVEYPFTDPKMRSSYMADMNGIIHPLASGIAWQLLSTTTTVTPADLSRGKIIDCRAPVSRYGATGAVINGSLKYLAQLYCVGRHARQSEPVICLVMDEYWQHVTSFDPDFLNQCRSHNACMFMLLQSIHSIHGAMKGHGEHKGEELLASVGTKIVHTLSDAKSAEYFSGLCGLRQEVFVGGSEAPQSFGEQIFGNSGFTASFSHQYTPVLKPHLMLSGLRSGGKCKIVDGIMIRNGQPFSNGECFLFVEFKQD